MDTTSTQDANKNKALDAALVQIERQFGKGAMMRLGDTPQVRIPPFPQVRSDSTLPSVLVAFLEGELLKSTDLSPQGRPP